ncbi:MAG: hypothetical protein WBM07_06930, partial [Chitinivibrionales bacterium]
NEKKKPMICWQIRATPNTRIQSIDMIDWSNYGDYTDNQQLNPDAGLIYFPDDSAGQDRLRTCFFTHHLDVLDRVVEGDSLKEHFYHIIIAMHTGRFLVSNYNSRILPFLNK